MDFVTRRIDGKIRIAEARTRQKDAIELYRVKIEYALFSILAALWHQSFDLLSPSDREKLLRKIRKPSIGSIIETIGILDDGTPQILNGRKRLEKLQAYTKLRNARIGHGYLIGESENEVLGEIKNICNDIYKEIPFLNKERSIIIVDSVDKKIGYGITIKYNNEIYPWSKEGIHDGFSKGATFVLVEGKYFRLDPFIVVDSEDNVMLFKEITDLLSGVATMNNIFTGQSDQISSNEFKNPHFALDDNRIMRLNGIISNAYENNFKQYVNIGVIKNKIVKFIEKDRASVAATIWGHGGVGKTAMVQSVCDDLYLSPEKKFDYVIFASAKNVNYNYSTGNIDSIENNISTFDDLISSIGRVMFPEDDFDAELILDSTSKLLLIIDDFETFPSSEKRKISEYISKMDINKNKVIFTTRAHTSIGVEFPTNELSKEDTRKFLTEIVRSTFSDKPMSVNTYLNQIDENFIDNVFIITSGRPLFILQLFALWREIGSISEVISKGSNLQKSDAAMKFLYGRIFDYLSDSAKEMFMAMGALVDGEDEPNLIEKISFALDKDDITFEHSLDELKKLRMIEVTDKKFFRAYSKEIARIMSKQFYESAPEFQKKISDRLSLVTKDKMMDNYSALLQNANKLRSIESENVVIGLYIELVNENKAEDKIRLEAAISLVDYLANVRGKKGSALNFLRSHYDKFKNFPDYVRLLTDYCAQENKREEGVKFLMNFIEDKPEPWWSNNETRLEIQYLHIMYTFILDLEKREKLYNRPDATDSERSASTKKLKNKITEANNLLKDLKSAKDLSSFSDRAKQNIVAGLNQYAMACLRLYKLHECIEACKFGNRNFPHSMTRELIQKMRLADRKIKELSKSKK